MEAKHTQGEWQFSKHGNNDSFGVYAENGNDIAIVLGGNEEGGEAEANAKLIAAAPDLLKALAQIQFAVNSGAIKGLFKDEINCMNEAISKATN